MKQLVTLSLSCALYLANVFTSSAENIPLDPDTWSFNGQSAEFVEFKGQQAIRLENAAAVFNSAEFETGIIEFDIAIPEIRGFMGITFREVDDYNYEEFYLRPHQSGKPDANQYEPVFNGNVAWQIYFGPQYSAPIAYKFDQWMHIKIVVADNKADIYLDSDEPVLHIADLKGPSGSGAMSFTSSFTYAHFANLSVTKDDNVQTIGSAPEEPALSPNHIMKWQLAHGDHKATSTADQWQVLDVETNGIANIARLFTRTKEASKAVARLTIESDADQTKLLHFGFSDDVTAYINGIPVFSGDDKYRTRDYRYLGTVGLYDTLHLHLKKGRNEVAFEVDENFGGWAINGEFENMDGIDLIYE